MPKIVAPGQTVADRFEILRFIDEGGMGEVYEAEDRVLGERVALKFLNRRNIGDERVLRRFRREIQLARKVTHPNVCRLFDVYTHRVEDGQLQGEEVAFVTMEMLAGQTLEAFLTDHGHLDEGQALPLIRQMAAALDAAHRVGIIHRDFKTSNVMLVPDEDSARPPRVVVTDFGLAQTVQRPPPDATPMTDEMKLIGTPDYMSPEQLRGAELGVTTDVYALGVVIFEMVTGARPYSADNTMGLLVKRVSEPPEKPRAFPPGSGRGVGGDHTAMSLRPSPRPNSERGGRGVGVGRRPHLWLDPWPGRPGPHRCGAGHQAPIGTVDRGRGRGRCVDRRDSADASGSGTVAARRVQSDSADHGLGPRIGPVVFAGRPSHGV